MFQGKTARDRKAGADVAKGPEPGLLGTVGLVTVAIPAAGPGEVPLPVRGGTETFAAWSDEPIARHTRIVVVDTGSGKRLSRAGSAVTLEVPRPGHRCLWGA